MVLPLYGFLEGDVLGLVVLAEEHDTVADLGRKLCEAAQVRVPSCGVAEVRYRGRVLPTDLTLSEVGIEPLERFDVTQVADPASETTHA